MKKYAEHTSELVFVSTVQKEERANAVIPRVNLDARDDLASVRSLPEFKELKHSHSGTHPWAYPRVAQLRVEPEGAVHVAVAPAATRHLGASDRVRLRRFLVLEALEVAGPSKASDLAVRLGERYELNCPGPAPVREIASQDLRWLKDNGHVEKLGNGGGTTWRRIVRGSGRARGG